MKQILARISVCSVLLGVALLLLTAQAPAQEEKPISGAKAFITETDFNFGYIPNNATVSHAFVVHSVGSDSLRILRVKPG